MSSTNSFTLIGNIGKDPELKKTAKGVSYSNMSMAVTKRYKEKTGETKTTTNWFNFTLWGNKAEALVKFIQKGTKIAIDGELVVKEREVGDKKIPVVEFNVGDVEVLSGGKTRGKAPTEEEMFEDDFSLED
jgi:single-strand DNA-binding protein